MTNKSYSLLRTKNSHWSSLLTTSTPICVSYFSSPNVKATMKYKVGDKVKVIKSLDNTMASDLIGKVGTIIDLITEGGTGESEEYPLYNVKFDNIEVIEQFWYEELELLQEIIVKGYNDTPPKLRIWVALYEDELQDQPSVVIANSEEEARAIYRESLVDKDGELDDQMDYIFSHITFEEASVHGDKNS